MSDDKNYRILCSGCATDAGLDTDEYLFEPHPELELVCAECSAVIVGFSYRVPEGSWSGMSPGPG
jgi:hypothetical protein